jgi:hypothetical protein
MINWDEILDDFAHKCGDGGPDMTNPIHLALLRESLLKSNTDFNDYQFATNEFIGELREDKPGVFMGYTNKNKKRYFPDAGKLAAAIKRKSVTAAPNSGGGAAAGVKPKKKKKKPIKKKKVKNKSLSKGAAPVKDFNNDPKFTETGIPDKDYNENFKPQTVTKKDGTTVVKDPELQKNSKTPFKFTDADMEHFFGKNTKFPKRYIKALERLMNLSDTPKPTITDVLKDVGAGALNAQAGEIITMMGATIKDKDLAKEFFEKLRQHASADTTEKPVITKSWIDSAERVRQGMFARYDEEYPNGWEMSSSAWDVGGEVESLGLTDYKENKGFSTDAYFVVGPTGGPGKLDEVSLKKGLAANLLNTTTGRVLDLIIRGNASPAELKRYNEITSKPKSKQTAQEKRDLDAIEKTYATKKYGFTDDTNVDKVKEKQQKKQDDILDNPDFISHVTTARNNLSDVQIKEIAASMSIKKADEAIIIDIIKNDIPALLKTLKHPVDREKLFNAIMQLQVDNGIKVPRNKNGSFKFDSRKVGKYVVMMTRMAAMDDPTTETAKGWSNSSDPNAPGLKESSNGHSTAVAKQFLKNSEWRSGLIDSIKEDFPLKALFTNEEKMHLGEFGIDQAVLMEIFKPAKNFEQLKQGLTISDVPPPPGIVYQATIKGKNVTIPIAKMTNRPDGVGYGENWKLEFSLHPGFKKSVKQANRDLGRT